MWHCRDPEIIISGPYECSKTFSCLHKIHALAIKYAGCNILLARKQYAALLNSAYQSYIKKVLPYPPGHDLCPVRVFGGGRPEWVEYANGSRIIISGLDIPEKVLSAEYDFVFVPQGEELSLHDYEQLVSRATGRAGNSPYAQVIMDCNPGPPNHWILKRVRDGAMTMFKADHKDNPTLWDHEKGDWTDRGRVTMNRLHSLTGLRYKRGVLGLWAGSEGQVYEEFDESIHIVDPFPIPPAWKRYRVMDFGFTHPACVQWWAEDADGRLYMYREIYHTGRTTLEHIEGDDILGGGIVNLSRGETYTAPMICDHDAEDRATLEKKGIKTIPAKKEIRRGIEAVQDRLKVQKDGKPRMMFFRGALVEPDSALEDIFKPTCTVEEFGGYVWRSVETKKEASVRDEVPIDLDNHGMDATRYMAMHLQERYGKAKSKRYA
jgi:phage terminase large subunit